MLPLLAVIDYAISKHEFEDMNLENVVERIWND